MNIELIRQDKYIQKSSRLQKTAGIGCDIKKESIFVTVIVDALTKQDGLNPPPPPVIV